MTLGPTHRQPKSGDAASGAPLHVLVEVWSADLRMGATNDPLDLAEYGRSSGLRVTLCGPSAPDFAARAGEVGAEWVRYTSVPFGRRELLRFVWGVLVAVRLLRRTRPDLVHINYASWGPSLALAARLLGIPVAARPGEFHPGNPGHAWIDGYVAITEAQAASVIASRGTADVRFVGPFISLGRLTKSPTGTGEPLPRLSSGCRFLYLGQLVPRKGIDILVRAFAAAGIEGELLLVGGDWSASGYPAELRQLVEHLDLGTRVVASDHRSDVGALLKEADVFVLPSLSEAIPRCVLEAMVLGTPVIATRVGGIPTVVSDESTGLLVEAGNIEDLAQALRRLGTDPPLRNRLASTAQAWAATAVDPVATAKRYVDAYRDIIRTARRRRAR